MDDEWVEDCEYWEDCEEWDDEENYDCPLGFEQYCDPSCPHWMGDGLCEVIIEEQAEAHSEWMKKHYKEQVRCKLCNKILEMYEIHSKEPWTINPIHDDPVLVGIRVYGPIGCRKKILHSYYDDDCEVLHICVEGKERLVKLLFSHPSKED